MQIEKQFVILVYPFRHSLSGAGRYPKLQRLNRRWRSWWTRWDREGLQKALDDTYFFLPYVRSILFPEVVPAGEEVSLQQVGKVDELARLPLEALARKLDSDAMLRLTCSAELLDGLHPLLLEFELNDKRGDIKDQFSSRARVLWIDAALFPQNIGFLLMKVQCDDPDLSTTRFNDFLYYLRQVHEQTIGWSLPRWRRNRPEAPLLWRSRDLVDFLLQGLTDAGGPIEPNLESFLERIHRGEPVKRYSSTEMGQVYGQSFREYTYVCLSDSSPLPEEPAGSPFATAVDRSLYELATCTQTADPFYAPHPQQVKSIFQKGHIALWQNWQGLAIHDSVVYLAPRPSNFTLHVLPHNLEMDYFHLYLLTCYQKIRLSVLSGELMRHGATLHRDVKETRALNDQFTMFRNHYWFPEVTFKPQGIELYHLYQQGLGISALYKAISEAVRDLGEYFERKAEQLNSRLLFVLDFVAFVVLPAEILAHIFADTLSTQGYFVKAFKGIAMVWVPLCILLLFVGLLFGVLQTLPGWKRRKE